MKNFKYIGAFLVGIVFTTACTKSYIDPIKSVSPGTDQAAPVVTITYPFEGKKIQVKEDVTSINFQLKVTDDIEIASIKLSLDGTELSSWSTFTDYRIATEQYNFTNLTNGNHVVTVTAADKSGKSTSSTVNFQKVAPYKPIYDGEVFYMPFEGDVMEGVSVTLPTIVGTSGFITGQKGLAYAGATVAYLSFPTTGIVSSNGFSVVLWYKINNVAPNRAGIITISPPSVDGDRTKGFRLMREGGTGSQNLWSNIGDGVNEHWYNPFYVVSTPITSPPANANGWFHISVSVSATDVSFYINGVSVSDNAWTGPIDWTNCSQISIASGWPNTKYWGHESDNSGIDELRIFNKALSAAEVQTIYNAEK
jgi:hypothetical protein